MTRTPIAPAIIEVDKCYRLEGDEVRLVTTLDDDNVTFCARGPRHFLDWHETAAQKKLKRQAFAEAALEEVPYFWEPRRGTALALACAGVEQACFPVRRPRIGLAEPLVFEGLALLCCSHKRA